MLVYTKGHSKMTSHKKLQLRNSLSKCNQLVHAFLISVKLDLNTDGILIPDDQIMVCILVFNIPVMAQRPHSQCSPKEIPKFLQNFRLQYNILKMYFQLVVYFMPAVVIKAWQ